MKIFYDTQPPSGKVYMATGPLPSTWPSTDETLTFVDWSLHMKNGFYYLVYNRGINFQFYYGLIDDKRNTTHGHFYQIGYDWAWPFDGVRYV